MMQVRRALRARQASYAVFDGEPYPWTLRESFGEYELSREIAEPGELVEELPDDATRLQVFDTLARLEKVRSWAEQMAWLRDKYPDEYEDEDLTWDDVIEAGRVAMNWPIAGQKG